jgi:hypothetical protein
MKISDKKRHSIKTERIANGVFEFLSMPVPEQIEIVRLIVQYDFNMVFNPLLRHWMIDKAEAIAAQVNHYQE